MSTEGNLLFVPLSDKMLMKQAGAAYCIYCVLLQCCSMYVDYVLHAEIKFIDMILVPHTPSRMAFRNHPHVNYRSKMIRMSRFTLRKFSTERFMNEKLRGPKT